MQDSKKPVVLVHEANAATQADLFNEVSELLKKRGAVESTFLNALKQREALFPTGLDFGDFAVAIPHIDPEHVRVPGLVVCRNSIPILFNAMDRHDRELEVRVTFWPLVVDPHEQVGLLAALLQFLQVDDNYERLSHGNPNDVRMMIQTLISSSLKDNEEES